MRLGERREQLQAAQDLGEGIAPRQLEEAILLERVDRHVEAVNAGPDKVLGVTLEEEPVRRHGQVVDIGDGGEQRRKMREVPADERLAPGQPNITHAHRAQYPHEPGDLLESQHLRAFEPWEALRRHAVLAAEVAPIGHGD